MRTPETPDSPPATTHQPEKRTRQRVLRIAAAASIAVFSSMHYPDQQRDVADDGASAVSTKDHEGGPNETERAALDAAADACFLHAQKNPMALGKVTYFLMWNPTPDTKQIKALADSMPQEMQPHFHTIARLVALHPSEAYRLKKMAGDKTGIELACPVSKSQEYDFRFTALGYLKLSGSSEYENISQAIRQQEDETIRQRFFQQKRLEDEFADASK